MPKPKVLALVVAGGEGRQSGAAHRAAGQRPALGPGAALWRAAAAPAEAPEEDASRQAVVAVDGAGRITGFHDKPDDPRRHRRTGRPLRRDEEAS